MMALPEMAPPRNDRRNTQQGHGAFRNLVLVASEPSRGNGDGVRAGAAALNRAMPTDRSRAQRPLLYPDRGQHRERLRRVVPSTGRQ